MSYDESMPVIPFRIEKKYKQALKDLAAENGITTNVLVRKIIENFFIANNIIETNPTFNIKKIGL